MENVKFEKFTILRSVFIAWVQYDVLSCRMRVKWPEIEILAKF